MIRFPISVMGRVVDRIFGMVPTIPASKLLSRDIEAEVAYLHYVNKEESLSGLIIFLFAPWFVIRSHAHLSLGPCRALIVHPRGLESVVHASANYFPNHPL